MSGITAEEQVAKKCYKNQTAGGLGVVKLDHLGAQVGFNVVPYGTVWLTDNEALLTARAPALAKDNPFEEQMFQGYDDKGVIHDMPLRPLILIEDDREIPTGDRFVPGIGLASDPAVAAAQADTASTLASNTERAVPTEATVPVLAPSMSAAVPPSHAFPGAPPSATPPAAEADLAPVPEAESWVENPNATLTPQPGNLGGSNEPAPAAVQTDAATTGSPTSAPPQQPAPQAPPQPDAPVQGLESAPPPAAAPVAPAAPASEVTQAAVEAAEPAPAEETAAVTSTGEETGAAATPVGEPPQGEFAAAEEVGSPDAPTATPPPDA
jgi:hypothetical protein